MAPDRRAAGDPRARGRHHLRVAGHSARYLYSAVPEAGHYLVADLGGGQRLTVLSPELDQPAIVALAEAVGMPGSPAVEWIGR